MSLTTLFIAGASGIAIALLGLVYKISAQRQSRAIPFTLAFLATAGLLMLGKAFTEPTQWSDWRLWALSLPMGILFYIGIPVIVYANKIGPASVNWTFVNLGLIVPIAVAPLLFHEHLLAVDAFTLLLFVVMLLVFGRDMAAGGETKAEHLLMYGCILFACWANNGIAMTLLKQKDVVFGALNSAGFGAIFYLSGAFLTVLTLPFTERGQRPRVVDAGLGALAGLCSGGAILLMFYAASLPAAVLFPITQGMGLLGGVLLTTVLYRERLTPLKTTGLVLGMAVLLCAGLRESLSGWLHLLVR